MRNEIVAIFLAALTGNAVAGWTALSRSETQISYVDKDSIRSSGSTVKMWSLVDYVQPRKLNNKVEYLSTVTLHEFDCADRRMRTLQSSAYEGQMREGANVYIASNTPWKWEYVEPGTVGEAKLEVACK